MPMDSNVLAAMARWPDVPAVYGWLSLDARGQWRLHPLGDAAHGGPGESISNPAILEFISRNYGHDEYGRWFFQNGPQRVFVRLDVAPLMLRLVDIHGSLATHTGQAVAHINRWAFDRDGHLFARTEHGPAAIENRDLPQLLEHMKTAHGQPLMDNPPDWIFSLAEVPVATSSFPIVYPPASAQPMLLEVLDQPACEAFDFIAMPSSGSA